MFKIRTFWNKFSCISTSLKTIKYVFFRQKWFIWGEMRFCFSRFCLFFGFGLLTFSFKPSRTEIRTKTKPLQFLFFRPKYYFPSRFQLIPFFWFSTWNQIRSKSRGKMESKQGVGFFWGAFQKHLVLFFRKPLNERKLQTLWINWERRQKISSRKWRNICERARKSD